MVNRALQPQEIEVFYVLPALRRDLTLQMKRQGKSQKEIAKLLGVTEPAISQYVKSKRASAVKFSRKISSAVESACQRIKDHRTMMIEVQGLLKMAREEKIACQLRLCMGSHPCSACFQNERSIS